MTLAINIPIKLTSFQSQVLYFNGMYKLPVAPYPTLSTVVAHGKESPYQRLCNFKKTLLEEIEEMDAITSKMDDSTDGVDILTELADLLGDIIVYCASEMAKFGIPYEKTLGIIMQSNFSKLSSDGTTIYNDMGKVMKGPYYYKPEPALRIMLLEEIDNGTTISPGLEK